MIIRREQMQAFARAVEKNLECAIFSHVKQVWRRDCQRMGEPAVRELIRKGIGEAGSFGIEGDYELLRYVDLVFLLSSDFSAGDRFPWAAAILKDRALTPAARMDRLYERARRELGVP